MGGEVEKGTFTPNETKIPSLTLKALFMHVKVTMGVGPVGWCLRSVHKALLVTY